MHATLFGTLKTPFVGGHTHLHIYLQCSNLRVLLNDSKCMVDIDVEVTDETFVHVCGTSLHSLHIASFHNWHIF